GVAGDVDEVLDRQELCRDQSKHDQRGDQEERQHAHPKEQGADGRQDDVPFGQGLVHRGRRTVGGAHAGTLMSAKKCLRTFSSEMASPVSSAETRPLENTTRRWARFMTSGRSDEITTTALPASAISWMRR